MSTNNSARISEITIAAGGIQAVNGEGNRFFIIKTNGPLAIRRNGAAWAPYTQGTGENLPPGQVFQRLEILNPSVSDAVTVVIYSGFGEYLDTRAAVVEPDTEIVAWDESSLDADEDLELGTLAIAGGMRRKCFQVTNLDPTLNLRILDDADNVALTVFPETSITLPVSGAVKVHNDNGTAVACNISAIWWMS